MADDDERDDQRDDGPGALNADEHRDGAAHEETSADDATVTIPVPGATPPDEAAQAAVSSQAALAAPSSEADEPEVIEPEAIEPVADDDATTAFEIDPAAIDLAEVGAPPIVRDDAPTERLTAGGGAGAGVGGRTPGSAGETGARDLMSRLRGSRASGAGILIAVLVGLLGFALVAQVKSNQSASNLSSDRPDDLVRILSDLDARKDRLNTEISSLRQTQQELQSGAAGKQAALAEAAKRADDLGILAGSIAAEGPGLRVTLSRGADPIEAADVLDMVEELRGAGAEAMEIGGSQNGATVRVIASTYFVDGEGGIVVDGQSLGGTLTLTVIGDPQTMQTALSIPGGAVDTIKQHGGNVTMASPGTVRVTALHPASTPKYAQPAS